MSPGPSDDGPFSQTSEGIGVRLLVTPKAAGNAVAGVQRDADGTARLKVTVTTVPEAGKANAAVIKLLSKCWGVPKSTLAVTAGKTERRKTILINGADGDTLARLGAWLKQNE